MPRLTWKQEPNEKRLARIMQYPRGFILNYGEYKDLASVHPLTPLWQRYPIIGWCWSCGSNRELGIEHHNNANCDNPPYQNADEAKAAAESYIRPILEAEGLLKAKVTKRDAKNTQTIEESTTNQS